MVTEQTRKKMSESAKKRGSNRTGSKHSEASKTKMSLAKKGIPLTFEHNKNKAIAQTGLKRSQKTKHKISVALKNRIVPDEVGKKISIAKKGVSFSEEHKNKIRASAINYLRDVRDIKFPCIGRNETKILNRIEKELNINIIRQKQVLGYFVDGYDEDNNVVYEVYEKFHNKLSKKDKARQHAIQKELQCEFVIIEDLNEVSL